MFRHDPAQPRARQLARQKWQKQLDRQADDAIRQIETAARAKRQRAQEGCHDDAEQIGCGRRANRRRDIASRHGSECN